MWQNPRDSFFIRSYFIYNTYAETNKEPLCARIVFPTTCASVRPTPCIPHRQVVYQVKEKRKENKRQCRTPQIQNLRLVRTIKSINQSLLSNLKIATTSEGPEGGLSHIIHITYNIRLSILTHTYRTPSGRQRTCKTLAGPTTSCP